MHLMNLRCFFSRHAWEYTEHFPAGDCLPDGYTVRKCSRCGKVQWSLRVNDMTVPDLGWVQGWPPRPKPKPWTPGIPKPPQGGTGVQKPQRSVESFEVKVKLDDGLWPEEQGTL